MDIKAQAKAYPVEDGAFKGVVFYFLPYRPYATDAAIRAMERVSPQWEYQNTQSGGIVNEEPPALKLERERAKQAKQAKKGKGQSAQSKAELSSVWTARRLWGDLEDAYITALTALVAVEFPNDPLSDEAAMFQGFWTAHFADIAERWHAFQQIVGTVTYNTLWEGYAATREMNPAPAPIELGQERPGDDSPLAGSDSEP